MRVSLKERELENAKLSWLCIEDTLTSLRGKDQAAKLDAYKELNEGQKGLYMFYAFHNHTKTLAEFYWFSSYFITELKGWAALKDGVSFYRQEKYIAICDEMEKLVQAKNRLEDGTWRQALASDLDEDEQLLSETSAIYERYIPIANEAIASMNAYIREHSEDFLVLTD